MRCGILACFGMCLILFASVTAAQEQETPDLTEWADGMLGKAVKEHRVSAAEITVVKDGELLFAKGYGYADPQSRQPLDIQKNRFLLASVSKIFTATALAKLLEDGTVSSLDDPVNKYLKRVQLPLAFGKEIRIRDLLTHTAGFEERGIGMTSHAMQKHIPASSEYIQKILPQIVREPGTECIYANIDPPLIGAMIEDITGMTLQDFMEKRLFKPLGMSSTILSYSATPDDRLVKPAYISGEGKARPYKMELNAPFYAPTGSIQTTAYDMAKFMLAHLGYPTTTGAYFLAPKTLSKMQTPLFQANPDLPGIGMNFFIKHWDGHKVVEHIGVFSGFQTDMILLPDLKTGIFIAFAGGPEPGYGRFPLSIGVLRGSVLEKLLGPNIMPGLVKGDSDLGMYTGNYWNERRPYNRAEIILFLNSVMHVRKDGKAGLVINGQGPYGEISPNVFAYLPAPDQDLSVYYFADIKDGKAQKIISSANAGVRVFNLKNPQFIQTTGTILFLICFSGILALFWAKSIPVWIKVASCLFAVAALLVPLDLFWDFGRQQSFVDALMEADMFRINLLHVAGYAMFVLSLLLVISGGLLTCKKTFRLGIYSMASWGHLIILALAGILLIPVLSFVNLIF